MKDLGSVYVEGKVPKIVYKGALTENLILDYEENEDAPRKKTYVYFFGIPYANPPVKEKRFEPPEPYKRRMVDKHLSYDAKKAKPNFCIQREVDYFTFIGSEDCLYLNIYLPKKPKYIFIPLPVLVYFHPGGHFSGSGNYEFTTPDCIIKENIIFVTVNYRLGPFGFLNMHTKLCKGNAGLKDQVMALQWIKDNIEAFRGDSENVTICGAGTGGTCVNFHLISPLSKGLFHKAIVQSGGIYCPWGFKGHLRAMMQNFKKYKNHEAACRDKVVRNLKSLGARRLLKLFEEIQTEGVQHFTDLLKMDVHLGPSFENFPEDAFIPKPPSDKIEELMEQTEPVVPILAGINSKEGYIVNTTLDTNWARNKEDFIKFLVVNRWKEEAATAKLDAIWSKYFPKGEESLDIDIEEGLIDFCTDLCFHRFYDNFKFGKSEGKPAAPLYVYQFTFVSDMNSSATYREHMSGAGHHDDLVYLFPSKETRKLFKPFSQKNRKTIKTMCSLWASFCRTGKPTCPLYPNVEWLPHTENEGRYLEIGEEIKLIENSLFQDRWDYFKKIFSPDDQVPTRADTPTSVGCCIAKDGNRLLTQLESLGTSYEHECDITEIPKYRKLSILSKSSGSTPRHAPDSQVLSSLDNPLPGTSSGFSEITECRKRSILSKSSTSAESQTSKSPLLMKPSPDRSRPGISRTFKRFFSLKKKY